MSAAALLDRGHLEVSGGHRVYWEMAGNPAGIPAVVLHGGPGSGCRDGHYDLFDLDRFRVILLDQRGCGRSTPLAGETPAALAHNTTEDLLGDLEALRRDIGIERWLVFGGSWGSTLALLYAQRHPDRISALVLAGVATTEKRDLHWLYEDVGNLFPEAHCDFRAAVPDAGDVWARIAAYSDLLGSSKAEVVQRAADAWCRWELAILGLDFDTAPTPWGTEVFRRTFARIVTHYFRHHCWIDHGRIASEMDRIAHVPGVMIHSRFDPSCPLRGPWDLSRLWPAARLEILPGHDHSALSATMRVGIRAATDGFASVLK